MLASRAHRVTALAITALSLALAAGCAINPACSDVEGNCGWSDVDNTTSTDEPETIVLAMDQILIGETDPDFTPNRESGWKQYGLDIDGVASNASSTGLCRPREGSTPDIAYPDGDDGKDNSFGKNVLPLLMDFLAPDFTKSANEAIDHGFLTHLITIEGLGRSASGAIPSSSLYRGLRANRHPKWDSQDEWPLDPTFLIDPSSSIEAKNIWKGATIEENLYESGPAASFSLFFDVHGAKLFIPIHDARVQMQLKPGRASATSGQIAGIVSTEELVQEITRCAQRSSETYCSPGNPVLEELIAKVRQAADILSDGTQDPTKECDSISMGIGFTMKRAKLGPAHKPYPDFPETCEAPQ